MLDRLGVNRAISIAVGWWSIAGIGTGLVRSIPGLFFCRSALAAGESAGVPSVGKVNGLYLKPSEHALGAAVIVRGALRRGGTPVGTAMVVAGAAVAVVALAWVPVAGFIEAIALPALAARLRRRAPERYAGLRTLAK